jgi:hypothetical protein
MKKFNEFLKESSINDPIKVYLAIYGDKYEARISFSDMDIPNPHLKFSNIRKIIKEYGIPKENEDKFFLEIEKFPETEKIEIEKKLLKMSESFRAIVVKELTEFVKKTEEKVIEVAEKYGKKEVQ